MTDPHVDLGAKSQSERTLKAKVVGSLAWLSGAKLAAQILTWAVTLKVIAILDPADYGLLSLALVGITFLLIFNELGLGAALIQRKELDNDTIQRVFGVLILVNFLIYGAAYSLAPAVAAFFDDEKLVNLIRVLALQFPLMSLTVIPRSLLARSLWLKETALIDLAAQLTNSAITLALALSGYGVWSLVFGSLVGILVRVIGLNFCAPCLLYPKFDLLGMRQLASFSASFMTARVIFTVFSQLDVLIAGKVLDKTTLGLYTVSSFIATMPMLKLLGIVNQVGFPAFSNIQSNPDQVGYYFLKSVRLISIFSVPVLWGISAITPELVNILFDDKWQGIETTLQLLALIVPIRLVNQLTPPMLFGTGKPGRVSVNFLLMMIVMFFALLYGSQWGAAGMAIAWIVAFPLVAIVALHRSTSDLPIGLIDVWSNIWRPMLAGVAMYLAIILARDVIEPSISIQWLLLIVLIGVGAIAYSLMIFLLAKPVLTEIKALRSGGAGSSVSKDILPENPKS
ncbi:MAG: lipopolysaccharide biosynthesis protein [Burkholderiaceae bacterium]